MDTFTSPYSLIAALGAVVMTVVGRILLRGRWTDEADALVPSVLCGLTVWLLLSCVLIATFDAELDYADSSIDEFALLLFHSDWSFAAMLIAVSAIFIYRGRLTRQKHRLIGPVLIGIAAWVCVDRSYLFWLATGNDAPLWHHRRWSEGFEGAVGPILMAFIFLSPVMLITLHTTRDSSSPMRKRRLLAGFIVAASVMITGFELLGVNRSSGRRSYVETTYVNRVRTGSRLVVSSGARKEPGELYIYALGGLLLGIGLLAPFPETTGA